MSIISKSIVNNIRPFKFAHEVVDGLSVPLMKGAVDYLASQFRETFKNKKGLEFVSLEVMDPISAAKLLSKKNHPFDINRTDFALANLVFKYKGEELDGLPLYVPVAAPIMYIAGAPYQVRMVLSDKLLSPGDGNVFMRLYRGKTKISAADKVGCYVHVIDDEGNKRYSQVTGEVLTTHFFMSNIPANDKITKSEPTLMLYLLAKFGYSEAMRMVLGYIPEIIEIDDNEDAAEKEYDVFSSRISDTKMQLIKLLVGKNEPQIATRCGFRVHKHIINNLDEKQRQLLINIMVTMFYILDGLPSIKPDNLEMSSFWLIPLRETLYGKVEDDRRREMQCNTHMGGLESYVTDIVIKDIHLEFGDTLGQDFTKDGFFKLMVAIIHNYGEWRNASPLISSTVTDKRFRLYYYMFVDIITQMNVINMLLSNPRNRTMDSSGVLKLIRGELNIGRMFRIKAGAGKLGATKKNQSVLPLSSLGGDCKYYKVTSDVGLQVNSNTAMSRKGAPATGDPTTLLAETQCISGTMNAISKQRLSPLKTINCYTPYDNETRTIRLDQQAKDDLKHLRNVLSRTSHRPNNVKIPKHFDIYGDDF